MKFSIAFLASFFFFTFSYAMDCERDDTDVLIVGGGPSGLVLSKMCELHKIPYTLVETNKTTTSYSKATGLHISSMKILNELGIAQDILDNSIRLDKNILINNDEVTRTINFNHGELPHERNTSISQEILEKIFLSHLNHKEKILYGHTLTGYSSDSEFFYSTISYLGINPTIKQVREYLALKQIFSLDTVEKCIHSLYWNYKKEKSIRSKFIVGADGGKSSIRKKLGISFDGETNPELSFSFDARIENKEIIDPNSMYVFSNSTGRIVVVPINDGLHKIAGKFPNDCKELESDALETFVLERSPLKIIKETIVGKIKYHVHSRITAQMRVGNILLIGDAAHVFYPTGGYGMNLGIKEAFLLGKAMNEYLNNGIDLLDSFQEERLLEAKTIREDATKKQEISKDLNTKENVQEVQAYI